MERIFTYTLLIVVLAGGAFADVYIPGMQPSPTISEGKCDNCRVGRVDGILHGQKDVNHNYDVKKYTIDIDIDDSAEEIDATVTVNMDITENGVTQIELDLDDAALTVTQCRVNGVTRSYTHTNKVLTVNLGGTYNVGSNL
ncbi:MAG: M1 family metallopeptidase, partial [bacterium]|nr:M1 family metallopeptidase [bacterium]